ncbi:MAG: hypothetical protein LBL35_01845 [Clostridiales bacterium]|jgi:hypothetical protein|nr:hypothetical protein [Clostridiales bacterium]
MLMALIKKEDGAASVLVVFMMIALVTLGAFSITSALSNLRLAVRNAEWIAAYYEIEDKAEEYLVELDQILADCAEKAESQEGGDKTIAYADYIKVSFSDSKWKDSDISVEKDNIVKVRNSFASDDDENSHIDVEIATSIGMSSGTRYEITEWRQWQTFVGTKKNVELWDGSAPPPGYENFRG